MGILSPLYKKQLLKRGNVFALYSSGLTAIILFSLLLGRTYFQPEPAHQSGACSHCLVMDPFQAWPLWNEDSWQMHRHNHYPTQPQTLGEDSWPMYRRNDYPIKPQSEEALWPMHRCNDYPTQPLTLGEGSWPMYYATHPQSEEALWPMYRRNDYPTQPQTSLNEKASCQMYGPQVREIQAPHWPKTQPILALPTALQWKRLRPLRPGQKPIPKAPLRKLLTDEDRQSICQYHEANPSAKQTEIGGETELESSLLHFANFCYSDVWG